MFFVRGQAKTPLAQEFHALFVEAREKIIAKAIQNVLNATERENGTMVCPVPVAEEKATNEMNNKECRKQYQRNVNKLTDHE